MKKHSKSHLTKNWRKEWAINGNFDFSSFGCNLVKNRKDKFCWRVKNVFQEALVIWSTIYPTKYKWLCTILTPMSSKLLVPTLMKHHRPNNFIPTRHSFIGHTTVYIFVGLMRRATAVLFRSHCRFIWSRNIQDFLMDSSRMILGDFVKLSVKDLKKCFLIGCLPSICIS